MVVKISRRLGILSILFGLLIGLSIDAFAEEPQFRIEIFPKEGSQYDQFRFSTVIEGKGRPEGSVPVFLHGGEEDFDLTLVGPQTSLQIVNGATTYTQATVYKLIPKRSGTLKTPEVEFHYNNKKIIKEALSVVVKKAIKKRKTVADGSVRITQDISKTKAYLGEQLVNTSTFIYRTQINQLQLGDATSDGFIQESMGDEQRGSQLIKGRRYQTLTRNKALFPIRTGQLTISSKSAKGNVVQGFSRLPTIRDPFTMNNFFNQFDRGGSTKPFEVSSPSIPVEILPLPPLPSSETLTKAWNPLKPLVGTTTLFLNQEKEQIQAPLNAGEQRSFTLEVTTSGNFVTFEGFKLPSSDTCDIYDELPRIDTFMNRGTLYIRRKQKFTVVGTASGPCELPLFALTTFNPEKKEYEYASKLGGILSITGESPIEENSLEKLPKDGQRTFSDEPQRADEAQKETPQKSEDVIPTQGLSSQGTFLTPQFKNSFVSTAFGLCLLGVGLGLLSLTWLFSLLKKPHISQEAVDYRALVLASSNYQELYDSVGRYFRSVSNGDSLRSQILNSDLSDQSKEYVLTAVIQCEENLFNEKKGPSEISGKSFHKVKSEIKKVL